MRETLQIWPLWRRGGRKDDCGEDCYIATQVWEFEAMPKGRPYTKADCWMCLMPHTKGPALVLLSMLSHCLGAVYECVVQIKMSRWMQRVSSWNIVQLRSQKAEVGEAHFPGLDRQKQPSDSDFCLMEYGEKDHWIRMMHLDATVHGYYNGYAISFHPRIKTLCITGSSQVPYRKEA